MQEPPTARAQDAAPRSRGWAASAPSLVALAACAAIAVAVAFDAGGYFPTSFVPAGAAAFAVLAVLLAIRLPHWRLSGESLLAIGALAALAAWTGLSATWAPDPSEAVVAFQRALFYLGFFALALMAAGSGRPARIMLWSALAVAVVIAGAGLLSRLFPELIDDGLRASEFQDFRLSYPLGYWNAFGAAAAVGAILALGMAADPRAAVAARAVTCGLSVLLTTAMYFSLSRGSWLALGAGLVALLLLGAHRGALLTTLAIAGVATFLAVIRLRGYDALVDDPAAGSGQVAEGRAYAVWLFFVAVAAGVVQAIAAGSARATPIRDLARRLRRGAVFGGAFTVLVLVAVYFAFAGRIEGNAADALRDSSDWIDRQWDDFMTPASFSASGTGRLTTAKGSRSDLWRVAFDGFEQDPLRGDGAGAFQIRWTRERDVEEDARDAHSLGFETLGELGLVGGLLLLAFLGAAVRAAIRGRSRAGSLRRSEAAAGGAAALVWVGHSMVDWDWQVPGLTCIALLALAPLFPEGRTVRRRGDAASSWLGAPLGQTPPPGRAR